MMTILSELNEQMAAVVQAVQRSLVQIRAGGRGIGAGTIWHADGLILTNAHVIHAQPAALEVTLPDGRTLPARVLARDERHDLAALAVAATDLPTITLGDSRTLRPGAWVFGVGHPWGVTGAVTGGAVIDVGPAVERPLPQGDLIQVGLHLRPGHSGGPLVDVYGRLVGINAMINGPDVGLAIPLHVVTAFLKQVLGSQRPAEAREAAPAGEYL